MVLCLLYTGLTCGYFPLSGLPAKERFLRFLTLAGALCALALLGACREPAGTQAPALPEVVVRVVELGAVPLQTELPGRTTPFMVAEVRPQVGGIIRARPFTEGAMVRAGQVLYEIEPASFRAAVEQQEGALANARAAVSATRTLAERYKALLPMNGVSKQEYDNAVAAHEQALAGVRMQAAALNTARINLQHTRVTAPIAGRTSRSTVTPGALVSASQAAPLLTISQLDPIYVDIEQSSTELVRLRQALRDGTLAREADPQGQRVSVLLEDGSPYPHEGRVQLTEVTVDPSSGSVTLRAKLPNPDGLLLPGMYVRAVVAEGSVPNAVLVPQQAITRSRRGDPSVRVVKPDDTIETRPVTVARAMATDWLVTAGLVAGERLVLEGGRNTPDGAKVKVVQVAAGAADAAAPPNGPMQPAPGAARAAGAGTPTRAP